MTREIKFRMWEKLSWQPKGNMDYFPAVRDGDEMLSDVFSRGGCIFMQFTGLKDKNGKEIYEGDILQTYPIKDVRFLVGYGVNEDNNSFGFTLESLNFPHIYPFEVSVSKMEVIGNIYGGDE